MKFIKGISYALFALLLFGLQLNLSLFNANANSYKPITDFSKSANKKTLRDLKNELADWVKQEQQNKNQQNATQGEISSAKSEIVRISNEREQIDADIINLEAEIEDLNKDIIEKNEELREIMTYHQLTASGEDAYLEYIFTATDFTDFIYRMAIAEQLTDYNQRLIDDYNEMLNKNEDLKKQKEQRLIDLENKRKELEGKVSSLQNKLTTQIEGALTIGDEIKILREHIRIYEVEFKCPLDQLLSVCEANRLPPGTAFYRPIITGRVTSNWGSRTYKLNGKWTSDFHYAVDFGGTNGQSIYPVAPGRVVARINRSSCGGNMLYVIHNVTLNGVTKRYTSAYYHLASINVKVGETVRLDTVIGKMGGSPSSQPWDRCSTGTHLHFGIANGHYLTDYSTYSGFIANSFNPRKVINMPATGVQITDRNRKY